MDKIEDYKPVLTRENRLEILTFAECEEIFQNWLLDNKQKGQLKKFEVVPATEHTGFLGEYFHLNLSYQLENAPAVQVVRLFVKSVIYQNADMTFYMEKHNMLKKEAMLYSTLINELKTLSTQMWCAKCYYTRNDLFVMQNIEDLGYVSIAEQTRFLDEAELLPILKGLATMHASSMAYERKHNQTIGVELRQWLNEVSVDPDVVWWTTALKAIRAVAALHPKVLADDQAQAYIKNELLRALDNVYYMVNPSSVHRNVFCHRDAWGGNVFYHKSQSATKGCVFVDYQLCRYSPPAIDFLFALYVNLQPKQRQHLQARCIDYYYENLAAELQAMGLVPEQELSRANFEKSIKDFQLFGAAYNCVAATVLRLPNNYLKTLKETRPADFHRFCNVDREPDLLALISEHEGFAKYMFDCIEDLLNLTYFKKVA